MPVALVAEPRVKSEISVAMVAAKVKAKALGSVLTKRLARDDSRKRSLTSNEAGRPIASSKFSSKLIENLSGRKRRRNKGFVYTPCETSN
ncbi:hypothetical protein HZH66_014334 [Vespula vulgaris]|uniref:Uncharacterized protein n=1 Tax=Vespula vulgaris TaxID=7454 RepID=A0A834MS52_VESVU|nr:hypothetical protein HZH66_014334 [Vespula vulgaris]